MGVSVCHQKTCLTGAHRASTMQVSPQLSTAFAAGGGIPAGTYASSGRELGSFAGQVIQFPDSGYVEDS